jgi:putative signal transducing protein
MNVVEIYNTNNAAEARCVFQILDDATIKCCVVGGDFASLGLGTSVAPTSILVAEDDAQRARDLLAVRLAELGINQYEPKRPFQFGLAALFTVITLVAIVLGLYPTLGAELTLPVVLGVLTAILMVFAYIHKRCRPLIDEASTAASDADN